MRALIAGGARAALRALFDQQGEEAQDHSDDEGEDEDEDEDEEDDEDEGMHYRISCLPQCGCTVAEGVRSCTAAQRFRLAAGCAPCCL